MKSTRASPRPSSSWYSVSDERYPVGTRLFFKNSKAFGEMLIYGTVVPNFKLPGDVCIRWDNSEKTVSSYDPEFLDEYCEIVNAGETAN